MDMTVKGVGLVLVLLPEDRRVVVTLERVWGKHASLIPTKNH